MTDPGGVTDTGSAPGAPLTQGVAAFDFDGTLVPGDSLIPFLARVVGPRRLVTVSARRGPALVAAYRNGGRDAAKAVLIHATLGGVPLARAQRLGQRYGADLLHRVRPPMWQAIAWHRARGHRIILVSASLALYLEPFGQAAGFEQVIATRLSSGDDGCLTGHLDGANVRGPEKARRLEAALGGANVELWAYGNSRGDRELLAMADHPKWVRRRPGVHADPRGPADPRD